MQVDIVLPQSELSGTKHDVVRFIRSSEDAGYQRLVVYDHVLGAVTSGRDRPLTGPYDESSIFHEPLVLIGFAAAITERIELMTGVLVAPQRQTALLAKQAAELQILSEGRLVLGVGTGWNHVEYESLAMPFAGRGAMLEEQVTLLRRLWTEPVVDVEWRRHRIDRAGLAPLPPVPPPVWFGGSSARAYERAARLGDGFIHPARGEAVATAATAIRAAVDGAGRGEGFEIEFFLDANGGPDDWARGLDAMAAHGANRVAVRTIGLGLRSASAHLDLLERVADLVRRRSPDDRLTWTSLE